MELSRRTFIRLAAASPAAVARDAIRARLPEGTPAGVAAILASTLAQEPSAINTDWFGTCLMKGLLDWAPRIPEVKAFGKRWLDFHLASGRVSPYSGNRSRPITAGGIHITTYVGHFGLAMPCDQLFRMHQDPRARRVAVEIADIILHKSARNRFGMTAHDDTAAFAIPDTCYFVVEALSAAARLTGEPVYRDHALYQIRTYVDTFLDRKKGLAKTILFHEGIGKTYWTRASGWLLWSITGVLRFLPPSHPEFQRLVADLQLLAGGMARSQDASGGLRVYLDDPASPLETTGAAMCATGLHESVRRGWLPESFRPVAARAWRHVTANLTEDGDIRGVYTGWAVPAEQGKIEMDRVKMGWIPGFVLGAAAEMSGTAV